MDLQTLETQITKAYTNLQDRQSDYLAESEKVICAKLDLEKARLNGLANGTIAGKNTDEREASARQVLSFHYSKLESLETISRQARLDMDLAQLEVDKYRALLRIADIATRSKED